MVNTKWEDCPIDKYCVWTDANYVTNFVSLAVGVGSHDGPHRNSVSSLFNFRNASVYFYKGANYSGEVKIVPPPTTANHKNWANLWGTGWNDIIRSSKPSK
ncbi:peptidase inhibitor family I36 protein [Klugiella xanthotipulae]|uniref:peptidase inhibitor family I36 protein n=1 Tax=Klugiella xanthotipulae TaxID=244735 RepID=UPI003CD08EF2